MILFFGIPAALIIAFVTVLILCLNTPKESEKRRGLKIASVVLGILSGITLLSAVMLTALAYAIVANM